MRRVGAARMWFRGPRVLGFSFALVAAAVALAGSGAATPCATGSVTDLYDYAGDVTDASTFAEVEGHSEVDLVEARSCLMPDDIALSLRVSAGTICQSPDCVYEFVISGPGLLSRSVRFTNHSAYIHLAGGGSPKYLENTTSGTWLTVRLPLSDYGNSTGGWQVEARARIDTDRDGYAEFFDRAEVDTADEYRGHEEFWLEPAPPSGPQPIISLIDVSYAAGNWTVVVEGNTTGQVSELRVAMGFNKTVSRQGNTYFYAWDVNSEWWFEQGQADGDPNVTLQRVGGSWARWRLVRTYPDSALTDGVLFEVDQAVVEIRSIAEDGAWAHTSYAFRPNRLWNSTSPPIRLPQSEPSPLSSPVVRAVLLAGVASLPPILAWGLHVRNKAKRG